MLDQIASLFALISFFHSRICDTLFFDQQRSGTHRVDTHTDEYRGEGGKEKRMFTRRCTRINQAERMLQNEALLTGSDGPLALLHGKVV